jgi:hypothetical protein
MKNVKFILVSVITICLLQVFVGCEKSNKSELVNYGLNYEKAGRISEYENLGVIHNNYLEIIHNDTNFINIYNNFAYTDSLIFYKTNISFSIFNPKIIEKNNITGFADSLLIDSIMSPSEYSFFMFLDSLCQTSFSGLESFTNEMQSYLKDLDTTTLSIKEQSIILGTSYILIYSYKYWLSATKSSKWVNSTHFQLIYEANQSYNIGDYALMCNIFIGAVVADALAYCQCCYEEVALNPDLTLGFNQGPRGEMQRRCANTGGKASLRYIADLF